MSTTITKKKDDDENPGTKSSRITLQDVLDTKPKEDEAQTRMVRSIEDQDDEEKGTRSSAAGILASVPERALLKSPLTDTSKKRSVEESLFHLTNQMSKRRDVTKVERDRNLHTTSATSQAEKLVENAEKLLGKARLAEHAVGEETTTEYQVFKSFLAFRKDSFWLYSKFAILYMVIPGLTLTFLLFYALGNPGGDSPDQASASWWINFVFVRNVLTLSLAKGTEAFVIGFCCIASPVSIKLVGPFFTLLLVQSKGWPFQLFMWGAYNFAMLYGSNPFSNHWLFYQSAIEVFNEKNQAGTVTAATLWREFLVSALLIGGAVCLKRFFVSLWFGQSVFRLYGKDLASVMSKAVLIGNVAALSKNEAGMLHARHFDLDFDKLEQTEKEDSIEGGDDDNGDDDDDNDVISSKLLFRSSSDDIYGLSASQKKKVMDLLGEWEEPTIDDRKVESAPVSSIVQFGTALNCIDNDYPFTRDFGLADKRTTCINSSQKLYLRFVKKSDKKDDSGILKFDSIAMVAMEEDSTLDETKLKDLIGIFRPTRDGDITMLDFVKSVDSVYKDLRVIRAAIHNAQKMNAASQRLVNIVFYFILFWVILSLFEVDPVALFAGIAAFIVGFAFMIGEFLATDRFVTKNYFHLPLPL